MPDHDLQIVREQLCPTGKLRAGINMTNGLLVTGQSDSGDPVGVSPDMAAAIAKALDIELTLIPYPGPGHVADALGDDAWDIGNIAAEPARAKTIQFSPSYCEIQATYLVVENSRFQTPEDVDTADVQIAAKSRAAYELWLTDNLTNASLVTSDSFESSSADFFNQKLDALAGLRPALLKEQAANPGTRLIEKSFTAVQQCVGCKHGIPEAASWLSHFVNDSIKTGRIQQLIDHHGVTGRLSVSPLSG